MNLIGCRRWLELNLFEGGEVRRLEIGILLSADNELAIGKMGHEFQLTAHRR